MVDTIGIVSDLPWERTFEWKIEGFTTLSTEDCKRYDSPLFYFDNESWCLWMYPNGHKCHDSTGYVDLFLVRKCSGPPIKLDYSLILKTMDEKTDRENHYSHVFIEANNGYGNTRLFKRSIFLKRRTQLGLPDVVTVVCTMKITKTSGDATSVKLSQDLRSLMISGYNSDTIIKVKEEELELHRGILAARNPYFLSMFKNEMKEKNTGVVSIDDCEPDIFRTFIHFIYTGKMDTLSLENACELYKVADKYQEDQMKEECLNFMVEKMSEDTFCDFIVLALKYDEKKLFEKAVEFFTSKPNAIVRSVEWQNFAKDYPKQANELIVKMVDNRVK